MRISRQAKSEYSRFSTLVCFVCFFTNLSQAPILVESALTRVVTIPMWLLLAAVCLLKSRRIHVGTTLPVWCAAGIFVLYYFAAQIMNENYGRSALPYATFLSLFVLLVGLMAGRHLDTEDIRRIGEYYLVGGIIVCVNVYFTYIYGNSIYGPSYLYGSKNSVSQILLTAWILILLTKFNEKGFWKRIFWLGIFCFLTWTLLALKSRATIIAIPILVMRYVFNGRVNKRTRNLLLLLLLAVVLLLLFSEKAYDIVVNQVLLSGRDATSATAITSGRSTEWKNFPAEFAEVWLFGAGRMKRESLILTALLEFGIFGGTILFLAVFPVLWGFNCLKKVHPQYMLFTSVAVSYAINGIFEQLAPFGPGVKCYFLWFLFGLLANQTKREKQQQQIIREVSACE